MFGLFRIFAFLFAVVPAALSASALAADRFDVLEYQIDGNSVLPALVVERAVYRHLGPQRGFDDVEAARAALEKAYQDGGYLTVSVIVPEQKVRGGVVRLQVVEGRVEKLKISGNQYSSRSEIREQATALAVGEVPYFPEVQKQLSDLSRTPDRRVTPLLRPGKLPGKLEVELAVEDKLPLHGNIELNNQQSPDTAKGRFQAGLRYDNLFQKQHSAGFNILTSPQDSDEVKVLAGFYSWPLEKGRSFTLTAMYSDSNVLSAGDSAVLGKGNSFGMRYSLPLPGIRGETGFFHNAAFGADYKDFRETQNVLGADQKVSPVRYLPFSLQYTAGHLGDSGDVLGNLSFVFATRGNWQRDVDCQGVQLDQFACRRFGARANFSYLRGDVGYTRRLLGWEYAARGDFQLAGSPLISNEQFLAGGMDSVRGYLEGEAAGDFGWRLRGEVKTPSWLDSERVSLRGVAFAEAAALGLQDALPGQADDFKLIGGGLGLRLEVDESYQVSADWARAFHAGPRTPDGEDRIHVRLGASF